MTTLINNMPESGTPTVLPEKARKYPRDFLLQVGFLIEDLSRCGYCGFKLSTNWQYHAVGYADSNRPGAIIMLFECPRCLVWSGVLDEEKKMLTKWKRWIAKEKPAGIRRDLACAECGSWMVLRTGKEEYKSKYFYGCSEFPKCDGSHGAHPDGSPLGVPATKEVKQKRMEAHEAFDTLWKRGYMERNAAYAWLADQMGMHPDDCHIGRLDEYECEQVIEIVEEYVDEIG